MYKISFALLALVVVVVDTSCNKAPNPTLNNISYLSTNDTLVASQIETTIPILTPRKIELAAEKYIVVFDRRGEHVFKLFELPEVKYAYEWGSRGRGPSELDDAELAADAIIFDSLNVEFYNLNTGELQVYTISDTEFTHIRTTKLAYDYQLQPLNGIRKLNDETYISRTGWVEIEGAEPEYKFIALSPDNPEPLFRFGRYPETTLTNNARYDRFKAVTGVKPDGKKLVLFYRHIDKGEIYDSKGNLLVTMRMPGELNENVMYRPDVQTISKYIFAHYVNLSDEDMIDKGLSYQPNIEVWDWEGTLLHNLVLDKPVHYFTVSEKYNKLYGISLFDPDYIYEYNLSFLE